MGQQADQCGWRVTWERPGAGQDAGKAGHGQMIRTQRVHPRSGGLGLEANKGTEVTRGEEVTQSGLQANEGPPPRARSRRQGLEGNQQQISAARKGQPPRSLVEAPNQDQTTAVVHKVVLKRNLGRWGRSGGGKGAEDAKGNARFLARLAARFNGTERAGAQEEEKRKSRNGGAATRGLYQPVDRQTRLESGAWGWRGSSGAHPQQARRAGLGAKSINNTGGGPGLEPGGQHLLSS